MTLYRSRTKPDDTVEAVRWNGATFSDRPAWLLAGIETGAIVPPEGSGNVVDLHQRDIGVLHTDALYPDHMLWFMTGSDGEFYMPIGAFAFGLLYEEI